MSSGWLLAALIAAAPVQQVVMPTQPEQLARQLGIRGEQGQAVQEALNTSNEEAAPIVQEMLGIRQDLLNLSLQGADKTEALARYADAAARMAAVEAQTFAEIYGALNENQESRAPAAFQIMGGIFMPPANAAVGGGR